MGMGPTSVDMQGWRDVWWQSPQQVADRVVADLGAVPQALPALVTLLGQALQARGWRVATAESCTGGGIAAALTAVAGSSAWVEGGYVTYSNAAKTTLLGVPDALLQARGAVSLPVVQAMALGACRGLQTECSVAVSGVAGPGGGSAEKPVGTVCLAWSALPLAGRAQALRLQFPGDRDAVRLGTIWCGLLGLLALTETNSHAFSGPD